MFSGSVDKLVLGTVNAPWKKALSADVLASKLAHGDIAGATAHMVTFFTEVSPDLVFGFAQKHQIGNSTLQKTYHAVKAKTGEKNAALESKFGELAAAA